MRKALIVGVSVLTLSACGGGGDDESDSVWKYDTCGEAKSMAFDLDAASGTGSGTGRYGPLYVDYTLAEVLTVNPTCFTKARVGAAQDYLDSHDQPAIDE